MSLIFLEGTKSASLSVFLVTPDDELDFSGGGKARILERLHAVEGDDGGALVVHGAAAVQFPVRNFARKGRVRPTLARGDYVEVCKNRELLRAVAENHFTDVVVVVMGFKPHVLGELQKGV